MREQAARLRRCALLFAIFATHLLLAFLLSAGGESHREPGRIDPASLTWIDVDSRRPETPGATQPESTNYRPRDPDFSLDAPIFLPPDIDATNDAIDWDAEGRRIAGDIAARDIGDKQPRPLDAHPSGMGPPPPGSSRHARGDSQHFAGGEVITWINDHCYYSNQDAPNPALGPALRIQRPVCKGPVGESLPTLEEWKKDKDNR